MGLFGVNFDSIIVFEEFGVYRGNRCGISILFRRLVNNSDAL